jgi:hypothetical protein
MVTLRVLVHGPLLLVEKTPRGELEASVTTIAFGVLHGLPASRV